LEPGRRIKQKGTEQVTLVEKNGTGGGKVRNLDVCGEIS